MIPEGNFVEEFLGESEVPRSGSADTEAALAWANRKKKLEEETVAARLTD